MFIDASNSSACSDWISASDKFDADVAPWHTVDQNIPASQWDENQRSIMDSAGLTMSAFADRIESLGASGRNEILSDVATLSAQYWRAFVTAIPSYTAADSYLSGTAAYTTYLVVNACKAAGK